MRRPNKWVVRSAPADQHAQLAGAPEQCLEWCRAFEDDVRGQFHLGHAVAVARRQGGALSRAEDRHQPMHPIAAASLQQSRSQAIGSSLERGHISRGQEGIVGFAEADPGACQLLSDKRVAIEVAGDVEREVGGNSYAHRPHDRVEHIPVVVLELFSTRLDETIGGVTTGRLSKGRVGDEGAALLHAGQHAGHALSPFETAVVRLDQFLFAHAARCGQDRDAMLFSDSPRPGLVRVGALLEDGRLDTGDADDVVEEVDQVLWALQPLNVAG
jgi:hypothetical protein